MGIDPIEKLKSEGWIQRFTASGARLQEAVENYRMLGFEVKTISVRELNQEGCNICFEDESDETVMIFTRRTGSKQIDEFNEETAT
ncbi:MAG: hypothetical protein JSV44_09860 [Candidatus Zixiibacteriota bacterium]|nr:MAG: hypothetical protein JSV44_09860 [candidate division Zixibacteria bacterium]